ncbi:MAG: BREX-2 system adenine-specific DNA-methyltransferase PglX, partial [Methylibium sp.]
MINAPRLLADLTRLLKRLEDDLRQRIADVGELKASLQAEWQAARDADRTAETFESWADQVITQAGVHWLLSCVFLRFIEDNELVERPWLGGTPESGRLALARDRHEAYFRDRPLESDRDYLLASFREAGALPGLHTFFDEAHNPVFRLGISGDAAMALRQFWQQVDPNTGSLVHDFTDADWNTRFLGDLYQDLSEATRKRYALLQTPEFVEEFILDRTLTSAIHEFGFREVRIIDPTCGSGHFLLGSFHRLVDEWRRHEPARNPRDIAQRALDAVAGVDLNPFAVAISRFRLLVAALKVSGVHRLTEAPDFKLNVAIGDSLLHGKRFGMTATEGMFEGAEHYAGTGLAHAYASEDLAEVQRILGRQYHAVVGNPPYIIVRDAALNAAYRQRYASCHMKYSLGVPFTERFFELAITGNGRPAGFVGLITANSFMKREFGSKLIEQVLPRLDLSHVIDTAGAYILGHGTPTAILFGRHRPPVGDAVRTVMGTKGEPSTPDDPAHGLVWSAILGQIDRTGSESEFVSVADTPRATFARHPWSIGGGGAAELREQLEQSATTTLKSVASAMGVMLVTGEDEVFLRNRPADFDRIEVPGASRRALVEGDAVRDWSFQTCRDAI